VRGGFVFPHYLFCIFAKTCEVCVYNVERGRWRGCYWTWVKRGYLFDIFAIICEVCVYNFYRDRWREF